MCSCNAHSDFTAVDLSRFDRTIDEIAKQLHDGKIKPADLDQGLISETYKELNKGAAQGYGKKWTKFPADGKGTLPMELKRNIYAFSSVKSYAQLEALNQLMYDSQGRIRPYNEFSQLAKKIGHQYNKNYLQAEHQTALTAAQMAQKWEKFQETKDIFPNLEFRTVGDSAVRDEHAKFDKIVAPIDSAFWASNYPPLDFRCRCDAVPTAKAVTKYDESKLPKVNFKGNVALDKEIFTAKGNFFKLAAGDENVIRNTELAKLQAPYETAYKSEKGKTLKVNIFADLKDMDDNIRTGEILVDELNTHILIRPHVNGRIIKGHKNAEYMIDDKLAERKAPESTNYKKVLSKANAQECATVVIDLVNNGDTVENAINQINNVLQYDWVHPFIEKVVVIDKKGKKVEVYERKKADQ